ncbi:stigma-specificIG1-like protein 1 [Populus alba x Populus x berolinensis]|nr:stigma-specificIG1-like protein 1 [Populus alba x Populus x berolinensis]
MQLVRIIFIIAMTVALSTTLTVKRIGEDGEKPPKDDRRIDTSTRLLSRFLAEEKNPRAADHCNKDNEICHILQGKNYKCCNNKCMDLSTDKQNCGACKRKCKYTEDCCRGECVLLSLDKRHCGKCNNRCQEGEFCVYGMCNYP